MDPTVKSVPASVSRIAERAEIRKADGSTLEVLVGDSGHCMSITTTADTLTADASIDEVKKAIDAGDMR